MWPDYIGSYLKSKWLCDFDIVDLDIIPENNRKAELNKILKSWNFDFIGFSYLSFQAEEAMNYVEIVQNILQKIWKREKYKDYIPIICWWRWVTGCEEYAWDYPQVDFWVNWKEFFQPIDTMKKLIKAIISWNDTSNIPWIVFKDKKNQIISNSPDKNPQESNIDSYFSSLIRLHHDDSYNFDVFQWKKTAQIYTQTGCNNSCSFCFESTKNKSRQSERSIDSIKQEIEYLIKNWYEAIYFDDSTFTQNKERSIKIMKMMGKYNIMYWFNTRIDCIDDEIIQIAKKTGCAYMFSWVESLHPQVIEWLGKINPKNNDYSPISNGKDYVEKAKKVYQVMKNAWLNTSVFLIFWWPKKENWEYRVSTIDDDKISILRAIWELEPKYLSFNILRFIPDAIISKAKKYKTYRWGEWEYNWWYYYNHHNNQTTHNIYLAFESAWWKYPIPQAMNPQRCYELLQYIVDEINKYYKEKGEEIEIITDSIFREKFLKKENWIYILSALEEIEKFSI